MESYVRQAPKRHELYLRNLEARRYVCREHGGTCAEWFIGQALRQEVTQANGFADRKEPACSGDVCDISRLATRQPGKPVRDLP